MKKIIYILAVFLIGLMFVTPIHAQSEEVKMCIDQEGYYEQGEWVPETYSCPKGFEEYSEGEKECRKYVDVIEKEYKNPVCPAFYHLQNTGNWDQRCHRDYNWMHPEHKAPTCPEGYSKDGNSCSMSVNNGYYEYADKVSNEDGYYEEDKWVEPTYKPCDEEPTPEPIPTPEVKEPEKQKDRVFHTLKGCYEPKPEVPQWAWKFPAQGGILAKWSAMGGEKVDIEVTNSKGEWEYKYYGLVNDGHEFLPNVSMGQLYRIRVIRVCKESDWLIDP